MWPRTASILACSLLFVASCKAARPVSLNDNGPETKGPAITPDPDFAGYVDVNSSIGSSLYYAFYEAQTEEFPLAERPILLWLQGGPGCASTFGAFYELGPYQVDSDLRLKRNPQAWNRLFGLLIIDQPVGTGYSRAGNISSVSGSETQRSGVISAWRGDSGDADSSTTSSGRNHNAKVNGVPTDMLEMARQLYIGLHTFFELHPAMQVRPFFITGESYGGKYVPAISHYVLQLQQQQQQRPEEPAGPTAAATRNGESGAAGSTDKTPLELHTLRDIAPDVPPPNFRLMGMAIGNGLTDPVRQTGVFVDAAYNIGALSLAGRASSLELQRVVTQLVAAERWSEAQTMRERLMEYVAAEAGLATLMDMRRTADYDAEGVVDQLLNSPLIKRAMRADPSVKYTSCSKVVGEILAPDVMKSTAPLVADALRVGLPVLLYQGQFDLQDGPVSNTAWVSALDWPFRDEFNAAPSTLWYAALDNSSTGSNPTARRALRGSAGSAAGLGGDAGGSSGSGSGGSGPGLGSGSSGFGGGIVSGGGGGGGARRGVGGSAPPAGWRKRLGGLTQVVVRDAGHMVPHDQPAAAQTMIEAWVRDVLLGLLEGGDTGQAGRLGAGAQRAAAGAGSGRERQGRAAAVGGARGERHQQLPAAEQQQGRQDAGVVQGQRLEGLQLQPGPLGRGADVASSS